MTQDRIQLPPQASEAQAQQGDCELPQTIANTDDVFAGTETGFRCLLQIELHLQDAQLSWQDEPELCGLLE